MKQSREIRTGKSKILRYVKSKELLHKGESVVIGVSGGIDSVVLFDFLNSIRQRWALRLIVAHVNYRLRGKESDKDEEFVRTLAQSNGITFYSERVNTKKIQKTLKTSLQVAARNIRYSFFQNVKAIEGADVIAVGHTADDTAETMLLNLFRGSGIDGMSGIPVRRDDIVRPLLCLSRNEIKQYAKARKLPHRTDASNAKEEYTRNFIRHSILTQAAKRINRSVVETMFRESEIFSEHREFVEHHVEALLPSLVRIEGNRMILSIEELNTQHAFIKKMVFHSLMKRVKVEPSFLLVHSLLTLCEKQKGKSIRIDKRWVAERLEGSIEIRPFSTYQNFSHVLAEEGSVATDDFVFSIRKSKKPKNKSDHGSSIEYIDASAVSWPITIRSWKRGDQFVPLGMKGRKKISDFFVDAKVPTIQKSSTPIIVSGNKIVWVGGYRLDDRFKLTPSTTDVYQLTLEYQNGKKNGYHQ